LITPQGWSEDEQLQLWKEADNVVLMHALAASGFDVNIKNQQGLTPARVKLQGVNRWMPIDFALKLCGFFSLGAEPPSLEELVPVRIKLNSDNPKEERRTVVRRKKLKDLTDKVEVLAVLRQAHGKGEQIQIPDEGAWIGTRGPLVNIALVHNKFELAHKTLCYRFGMLVVTISSLAMKVFARSLSFSQGACLTLVCSGLLCGSYYIFERHRAIAYLYEIALKALRRKFPPHAVFHHAVQDLNISNSLDKNEIWKI
jgi:hypothetical protein